MDKLDEFLNHHGVKGMKWGVTRNRNRPGGADGIPESKKNAAKKSKLGKKLESMKRERQWHSVLKEIDKLSTNTINDVNRRVTLENDLKRLSKSKVANKNDKENYLNRANMSNEELKRKVVRLKAKDNLHRSIKDASKEQRDFGKKVAQIGGSIGVQYAKSKTPPELKDVYKIINNPKDSYSKAKSDAIDVALSKTSNDTLKKAVNNLKKK